MVGRRRVAAEILVSQPPLPRLGRRIVGQPGAAGQQLAELFDREEKDVVHPVELTGGRPGAADGERQVAQPVVEAGLLQACPFAQRDRHVGGAQEGPQRPGEEPAAAAQSGQHGGGAGEARMLCCVGEQLFRAAALAAQVGAQQQDQLFRPFVEPGLGEHQLARAAEAPALLVVENRPRHLGQSGIVLQGGDDLGRRRRRERVGGARVALDEAGDAPQVARRVAGNQLRQALQQVVLEAGIFRKRRRRLRPSRP